MGFKAFLAPSGVDEFPPVTYRELHRALEALQPLDALTVVHAEDPDVLLDAATSPGRSYQAFVAGRPHQAEDTAISRLVELARRTHARVHVLHVSSAAALPTLAAARAEGLRVTAETCPHYLTLSADDVPDGATPFKCCPPIRGTTNRNLLGGALHEGVLCCVVSDHSPCTADLKALETGDFGTAWGGIASLQHRNPVTPYDGRELTGVVRRTWLRGSPTRDGEPRGRLIRRPGSVPGR